MSWIDVIEYKEATPKLKKIYDRVKGPNDTVDNVLKVHSLRPHSLEGHMALYKNVLHNANNQLPKWYLEAIGIFVSFLNKCDYCVQHHFEGYRRLIQDSAKAESLMDAIKNNALETFFDTKFLEGMNYVEMLTLKPSKVAENDIEALRFLGFTDGEILEINQVSSYFNYVNRTVLGLGVNTEGYILVLSPNDNTDGTNWKHS